MSPDESKPHHVSLTAARCRVSRRLGTVWNPALEPLDGPSNSSSQRPSATFTLTRSMAKSRSLWKQKQRTKSSENYDPSNVPVPPSKVRKPSNSPAVHPYINEDADCVKRFDAAGSSTTEFWKVDIRLTLLWCLAFEACPNQLRAAVDLWVSIISGTCERVDWGIWETGDEQWLRKMLLETENPTTDRFCLRASLLSPADWGRARTALQRRTTTHPGPLAGWSTRQRVLRVAWCTVTANSGHIGQEYPALVRYIDAWAHFTCPFRLSNDLDGKLRLHNRTNCFFSSCKVGVWQWFKAAVLDYNEGQVEAAIGCCARCVSRALPALESTPAASPINRPSVWPVVLWVVFQIQANGQNTIDDFLELLSPQLNRRRAVYNGVSSDSATAGMWTWDIQDEGYLRNALLPFSSHGWMEKYPTSWRKYLEMLDEQGWDTIEAATFRSSRDRPAGLDAPAETTTRIGTLALWASSAFHSAPKSPITITLDSAALLDLAQFLPSDSLSNGTGFIRFLIENPRRKRKKTKSIQYDMNLSTATVDWHLPHEWLAHNREQLRTALVTDVAEGLSLLRLVESVYWVWRIPAALPLRFIMSVYAKLVKQGDEDALNQLRICLHDWQNWGPLASLVNFKVALSTVIGLANDIERDVLPTRLINVFIHTDILTNGEEAQKLLDLIQDLLDYPLLHDRVRPVILKALLKLASQSKLHPRCFAISDRLQLEEHPVAAGSFGDVWKGVIHGKAVAVKIMRVYLDRDVEALLQEISQEGLIWRQLSHPNLLPFFGAYHLEGTLGRLCLVSPWMENGDIARYLKTAPPTVNKLSLVLDVALGLEHLHCLKLVHGDLKALNILISRSGRAVLGDFGLSSVTDSKISTTGSMRKTGGTVRWQAPELFRGSPNSFASDVYAFACVCYEIFTGNIPFFELTTDIAVMFQVIQGNRPDRPNTIPDALWKLMEECWAANPSDRPTTTQLVFRLRDSPIGAVRSDPARDWDPWTTSKFRSSLEEHTLFLSCGAMEDWLQFVRRANSGGASAREAFLSVRNASAAARVG
ncbi:hypothetical protein MIND_01325500 [Mycena indigotica]|uniref:Protein kinase domain-containing protein n=1 Tax=Mycena indigotica TaxID=2126181 RepID=A0A8H6S1Y8_9AGAR|nr:uncharacterized protein MIND_01325500 [Mycena indigotica]KAF7290843.1 hypothetical protein MIND_01325500 [Mycena indigotica]